MVIVTRSNKIQLRKSGGTNYNSAASSTERRKTTTKRQQGSSYRKLSENSQARLKKISDERIARGSKIKKLKKSLRSRSISCSPFKIASNDTSGSIFVKDELVSDTEEGADGPAEDELVVTKQRPETPIEDAFDHENVTGEVVSMDALVEPVVVKNEYMKDESEEIVDDVESDPVILRDLLSNYIRMAACNEDDYAITTDPLMANIKNLHPDKFYELLEIIRDTDFVVKNADVTKISDAEKQNIKFNCRIVHKNYTEPKRVVVRATLVKGNAHWEKLIKEKPLSNDEMDIMKDVAATMPKPAIKPNEPEKPETLEELIAEEEEGPHPKDLPHTKEAPRPNVSRKTNIRKKRIVTDAYVPTILKRPHGSKPVVEKVPDDPNIQHQPPPTPPKKAYKLDNMGKLIVDERIPAFSLYKPPTPATALSASQRLKLQREKDAEAAEKSNKQKVLKKLLSSDDEKVSVVKPSDAAPKPCRYVVRNRLNRQVVLSINKSTNFVCLPVPKGGNQSSYCTKEIIRVTGGNSNSKVPLKKLLSRDVDLDADVSEKSNSGKTPSPSATTHEASAVDGQPNFVCLPLSKGIPTIITSPSN